MNLQMKTKQKFDNFINTNIKNGNKIIPIVKKTMLGQYGQDAEYPLEKIYLVALNSNNW